MQLRDVLKAAKPSWSQQDLSAVEKKLATLGIKSVEALRGGFGNLNELLQSAGFKKFSDDTLNALEAELTIFAGAPLCVDGTAPAVKTSASARTDSQQNSFQSRMLANRGKSGFGYNHGNPFATVPSKGADPHKLVLPLPGADEADMWKGWTVTADTAAEPIKARAPVIDSYATELEDEEADDEDDDDEHEVILSDDELLQMCMSKGIPLHRLQSSKRAVSLIRRFDQLDKSSISTLRNEYKRRGFAPDASMRKEDLLARVKEVYIWENVRLDELREVCIQQQLPASDDLSRAVLIQLLADASWLARGIPVQQLPTTVVAHGVLDSVDAMSSKPLTEMVAHCKRLGLPLEAKPDKDDVMLRIRLAMVWKQMDEASLRIECEKRGAPLEGVPQHSEPSRQGARIASLSFNNSRSVRHVLDRLLLQSLWFEVWRAAGISLQSLGSHDAAAKLFRDVEKLRSEDFEAIQMRYLDLGLPSEQQEDARFVKKRVSESLFWEALSFTDLLHECESKNISTQGLAENSDTRRMLVKHLVLDSCVRAWASSGIPVDRLTSASAAAGIAEEWRHLETVSNADLKIKCNLHGIPADAILERQDLVQLLKDVAVWEALPVAALELENSRLVGPGCSAPTFQPDLDDWTRQCKLVEGLLLDRCAKIYEAKGIPARRLGSLKAAAKFAEQIKCLEEKDMDGLKQDCRQLGLPAETLQRQELLDLCRDVALWHALPLADLRLESRARHVAGPLGIERKSEEEQKTLLVDALLVERCEAWYDRRGIPVRRLASVQAAARVAERWEQLESMNEGGLLLKASAFSIHVEDLPRNEIVERLKSAMLWSELPLKELQRICRNNGVSAVGREDQRREILRRLTSALWKPKPPPPPPPEPKPRKPAEDPFGPRDWQRSYRKEPPPPFFRPLHAAQQLAGHFRTLGLPPNASVADVKKAYRRLALKYHPDKNLEASKEEASRRFREVADAYSALSQHLGAC
eukprot:TRINITY_DN33865_c0_g1_i1.p1 TRINITY_DN33865_c0_g1~~TRINITY_DN33865_c0_g1_i1.p1  ORF type:complete len:979 (+),score=199.32 TRINITY_DN33865_c0_g1_i1:73-3009(+)